MVGIFTLSIPGQESMSARAKIDAAADLGMSTCLFPHLLDLDADADHAELGALQKHARARSIELAAGMGWLNPFFLHRNARIAALGDGDVLAGFALVAAAAARIGIRDMFFMISLIEDRFDRAIPWETQLVETTRFLVRCAPILRDVGVRLLLKTHEEITTFEMVRLIETVGPDVIGVALDPVNVLVRMEDPVAATARLSRYVRQVHLDDAVVSRRPDRLRRDLCPLGDGQIDWPAILAMIPPSTCIIETHRGLFDMEVFDPLWRAAQPEMPIAEFAAIMRMAVLTGDAEPRWSQTVPSERLAASIAASRRLGL